MSDNSDFDDDGDFMIFPITDIDNNQFQPKKNDLNENDADDEQDEKIAFKNKANIGLRQRRRSHNALLIPLQMKLNLNAQLNAKKASKENELDNMILSEESEGDAKMESLQQRHNANLHIAPSPTVVKEQNLNLKLGRKRWKLAMRKIKEMKDPWEKFHIEDFEAERAVRHRYNALEKRWVQDEIILKIEKEPFNHGAMRECYRMKKLSKTSHVDWKRAFNYVAKRYMEAVDRDVYFEDVKLQMDAKLWGEEYNRHNPPKKVDIFQMSVLEFKNRPGSPLFHLEHFIEGHYIKYNSNSGFVEENMRLTPQAFSHFSFERSGHQMIIVDIQGVDDLWTDPQIHTALGTEYGDGNLGTKGMALFFYSHVCNSICESLHLTPFDLAPSECVHQNKFKHFQSSMTQVRGTVETCISASPRERSDLTSFLLQSRIRTISQNSMSSFNESLEESDDVTSDITDDPSSPLAEEDEPMSIGSDVPLRRDSVKSLQRRGRVRFISESESDKDTLSREEEARMFSAAVAVKHRPSSIGHEMNLRNLHNKVIGDSILGEIHHNMATYHEIGRFSLDENNIDWDGALFHEKIAADLGILEAIVTLAKIYNQLPHDVLSNFTVEDNEDHRDEGVDYMLMAAHAGDRESMIYMAQAYETGLNLGTFQTRSWKEAIRWYEAAAEKTDSDEGGTFDAMMDNPVYMMKAKMANMYLQAEFGLDKDASKAGDLYQEAADLAMEAMKGRLANKYYMMAEEAWGQMEEVEE